MMPKKLSEAIRSYEKTTTERKRTYKGFITYLDAQYAERKPARVLDDEFFLKVRLEENRAKAEMEEHPEKLFDKIP